MPPQRPLLWGILAISAALAIGYGVFAPQMYADGVSAYLIAQLKASSILVLASIAAIARVRLLSAALILGAAGDMGLAIGGTAFLIGVVAFLLGHLCYITLFLRAGDGLAALTRPSRALAVLMLIVSAIVMTVVLVPLDHALLAPLSVYTGVLTLMVIATFTLPAARWLVMLGGVLFFISDAFVAANMFHAASDPTSAFWRSFVGWMVYWAAQACLCVGGLALRSPSPPAEEKVA